MHIVGAWDDFSVMPFSFVILGMLEFNLFGIPYVSSISPQFVVVRNFVVEAKATV